MDAFERVDLVILDAPTGSGKTLIGETVGRMMRKPRLYICSSKGLQDQFVGDYPDARILKGRANYPTLNRPDDFHPERFLGHVSCEDCSWSMTKTCALCPTKFVCPYEAAKKEALNAEVAVLNTSYLLTEANRIGKFSNQHLIIVDEADTLEQALMSHVSVEIGERRLERYKWSPPDRVTVEDSWSEWLQLRVRQTGSLIESLPQPLEHLRDIREAMYLLRLKSSLQGVNDGLDSGTWTYTGRGSKDMPGRGVAFKPARVDHLGPNVLWRHSKKWLLMTATPISSQEMVESLGWQGEYATVKVPNTFPVENRRVHVRKGTSMSFRNREQGAWDQMVEAIKTDLEKHPDQRVLIHTVSYALAQHLTDGLADTGRVITYSNASERESALRDYITVPFAVLVAPSMGRGVDLPDDLCRVQMIAKIPYPYMKDRQVAKRMHSRGGQLWFSVQTVRALVQMCGRAVRSKDDWAVTYIYDTDFESNLWRRNRNLFPDWFREAIVWR